MSFLAAPGPRWFNIEAGRPFLEDLARGLAASGEFDLIFAGRVTPAQLGGLLMALRARGETVAEITGAGGRAKLRRRGRRAHTGGEHDRRGGHD